jgi:hypothetical protein
MVAGKLNERNRSLYRFNFGCGRRLLYEKSTRFCPTWTIMAAFFHPVKHNPPLTAVTNLPPGDSSALVPVLFFDRGLLKWYKGGFWPGKGPD